MKRGRIASLALALFFALSFVLDSFGSDVYASSLGNAKGAVALQVQGSIIMGSFQMKRRAFMKRCTICIRREFLKQGLGTMTLWRMGM